MTSSQDEEERRQSARAQLEVTQTVFRCGIAVATQPLEQCKILMQLGYEPIPPFETRTFFGRQALGLPGVFTYMAYIKRRDGFFGLYRGLSSRLLGSVIGGYVNSSVIERIDKMELFGVKPIVKPDASYHEGTALTGDVSDEVPETEAERILRFFHHLLRDVIGRTAAIIVSHPFQVITVRTVAQFIGRELKYDGPIQAIKQLYKDDGLGGFFAGLAPRLVGEVSCLVLSSSFSFLLNTYIIEEKPLQGYASAALGFISGAVTYPFTLVSNVMAVNDSGLVAGGPPYMRYYTSWVDCWHHLSAQNQLKRGSSLLWRYYTGPFIIDKSGHLQAVVQTA